MRVTSRGLARNTGPSNADNSVGGDGERDSQLSDVVSSWSLPVPNDAMDGRQRHIGCLRKLREGPSAMDAQGVDATAAWIRVIDTSHGGQSIPQNGMGVNWRDDSVSKNEITLDSQVGGTVTDVATAKVHRDFVLLMRPYLAELEKQGLEAAPTTTLWHFTSDKKNAKPTLKAAAAIVSFINQKVPGADLPPPMVGVRNREHYTWIVLGEWLMDNDPGTFAALLRRVGEIQKGKAAQFALGTVDQTHDPADDLG